MKNLIVSLLLAIIALPVAADSITVNNRAAYDIEIKWRTWHLGWEGREDVTTLHAGQSKTLAYEDASWVKVRADIPGYGWNHVDLTDGNKNHTLDAYGTATIFNPPKFYWGTR